MDRPSPTPPPRLARARAAVRRHGLRDERGAVTVDYTVLTAAVCGLGLAMTGLLNPQMRDFMLGIQGEVQETRTTAGGAYRPFDPDGWQARTDRITGRYGRPPAPEEGPDERAPFDRDAVVTAMRALLTDDEYAVLIGQEDEYAALQAVLESENEGLPAGWPDYNSF